MILVLLTMEVISQLHLSNGVRGRLGCRGLRVRGASDNDAKIIPEAIFTHG